MSQLIEMKCWGTIMFSGLSTSLSLVYPDPLCCFHSGNHMWTGAWAAVLVEQLTPQKKRKEKWCHCRGYDCLARCLDQLGLIVNIFMDQRRLETGSEPNPEDEPASCSCLTTWYWTGPVSLVLVDFLLYLWVRIWSAAFKESTHWDFLPFAIRSRTELNSTWIWMNTTWKLNSQK